MTQEALKLALEALKTFHYAMIDAGVLDRQEVLNQGFTAATAIKEALAQEQEPVAWMFQHDETGRMNYVSNDGVHNPTIFLEMNPRYALVCPLYTTPLQRKFVGLTDEEIDAIYTGVRAVHHEINSDLFARAIESKLKEVNT